MQIKITNIGYWYNNQECKSFPMPVENSASKEEIEKMLMNYRKFINEKATSLLHMRGFSNCRICKCVNGSGEYVRAINGHVVHMPEGIKHYIEHHSVLIPELLTLY